MPESLAERLSRFTPDGSGLDRDALLFAAGQASVRRPARTWGVLVGALAASQLLTLVLLWPGPRAAVGPVAKGVAPAELTNPDMPPVATETTALWALNRRAMQSESGELPREMAVERLVAAGPPLRAWAASSALTPD